MKQKNGFSTPLRSYSYSDTPPNLKIGALYLGHCQCEREAKPDVSAIFVPGNQKTKAIEEAIEAEIPLVVAVAEHVPIHDLLRVGIHSMLQTQSKTRLVGANSPGIISAIGKRRIGFQPLPCFSPGTIGIVAKSGTLRYEAVASTMRIFKNDPDTEGIIIVGKTSGMAEIDAAEWIKEYSRRTANPKPIMALVSGLHAPPGRIMGHAGAWTAPGEPDARRKYDTFERAGAIMVGEVRRRNEEVYQRIWKAWSVIK
ncbi:succinyl-CoA synthetase-like protein [Aspergillus coremiiformis]|uniref:Succinyl-CoA synthetase-like protein n=1 Tax=Aspergillus coremiiformis TaxID=138285 RepID=A0A5N6ZD87_9EURO|nr:succinyl-CoA synthetase-like protein [Aspergillus coremiiformis]